MNNDRIGSPDADKKLPKPEVSIIRSGESIYKPGMKTYFVGSKKQEDPEVDVDTVHTVFGATKTVVGGTICTCNMVCTCESVCTCNSQCSCQAYVACTCESYNVCTCNAVCSCESHCSCNSVCTCESNFVTTGCSCNTVCSCVPVH